MATEVTQLETDLMETVLPITGTMVALEQFLTIMAQEQVITMWGDDLTQIQIILTPTTRGVLIHEFT